MKVNLPFILTIAGLIQFGCTVESETNLTYDGTKNVVSSIQKKTHSTRKEVYTPERELAGFVVPEGFTVELVASEKDGIINPIDLSFDDAGRLWTQTAGMYPLDPVADIKWQELLKLMNDPESQSNDPNFRRTLDLFRGKTNGTDKILVLSNLYGDGPVAVNSWAEDLAIPQSILPYKSGCYVAQGSELFFLSDTNDDGKADKRTGLFTGFGVTDTHTMAHLLVRGPGDWIHFSHGALNKGEVISLVSNAKIRMDFSKIVRFSLNAEKIELLNSGLNNIWGFQLRGNGQWYGTEANDIGYSIVPMEIGSGFPGIGSERLRAYQPWMPELHDFRVGGTGLSGVAFADDSDGSFPDVWKDVALLANPITSTINAVKIQRNPDGSVSSKHLADFLTSEDDWFRPVNLEFGPDGCLYVADWYNKIISHNELPTTHPDRDKSHGRIWRIRHESQKPREVPNLYNVKTSELVKFLRSPSLWEKRAAWHQISDRPIKETIILAKDLVKLASDQSQDEVTRILALWSLEGIHHYNKKLVKTLLSTTEDNLKREAIRSLATFINDPDELANCLAGLSEDSNPMVRAQVLRTLAEVDSANQATINILINACKPDMEGYAMGSSYERKFERYLARKALEQYPKELAVFINSSTSQKYDPSNLIWASQALPDPNQREQIFLSLWKKAAYKEFDEPTFIIVANMLNNEAIFDAVKPVLENKEKANKHVSLAVKNQSQVQSDALTNLLVNPIRTLILSNQQSAQELGLEAASKFKVNNVRDAIASLINSNSSEEILQLVIAALSNRPEKNTEIFKEISLNDTLSLELRANALNGLAKGDQFVASQILKNWLVDMPIQRQKVITTLFSSSKSGSNLLKEMIEKGLLTSKAFDLSSAERVYQTNEEDPRGIALLVDVIKLFEEEKKNLDDKLQRFIAIAEKNQGNPSNGETLFQTCLLCHGVGDQGQDIAPALDGSALRENEALLTAILDPDAALESSYAIYRVTKKDGTNIEGYLVKRDNRGTTIAFMGGSQVFIESNEIKEGGYVSGRSFMPKGLIDHYSEQQVSDLLSYIKTLK